MVITELDFDVLKTLDVVRLYENETGYAVKRNTGNICPFCDSGTHSHHTGAFALYPGKQSFYCFACQRGGSVLDFVAGLRQCDTKSAAEYLNREYFHGQAVRERDTQTNKTTTQARAVASFRAKQLNEQPTTTAGTSADGCKLDGEVNGAIYEIVGHVGDDPNLLDYLDGRGFTADIRQRWNIRTFSASSYAQINKELRERFPVERLRAAGVLSAKDNFIFYNHRVLLFNRNHRGEFLNIKARAVPGTEAEQRAKYMNQHGGKFPFCTSVLYTATPGTKVSIVEGEFDAIAANELGGVAVAVGGVGDNPQVYGGLLSLIARRGLVAVPCFDKDEKKDGQGLTGGQRAEAKFKAVAATVPGLRIEAGRVPKIDGCKDFADVLQRENVTKCENLDTLEPYLTTPKTWRVAELAKREKLTPLEVRRAFMDFIKQFNIYNIEFANNYDTINIKPL